MYRTVLKMVVFGASVVAGVPFMGGESEDPSSRRLLDSVCGSADKRFLASLVCKDGTQLLTCAPNNAGADICTDINTKWANAKCKHYGGFQMLDKSNTGCYPMDAVWWSKYNDFDIIEGVDFCESFPTSITYGSGSGLVNLDFEMGTFEGWTKETASTILDPFSIVPNAPQGNWAAKISTIGTSPSTPPNKLSRELNWVNGGGCNTGNAVLKFKFRFTTTDYVPYNDYMKVTITSGDPSIVPPAPLVLDVNTVGNGGDSGWLDISYVLGAVPAGSKLSATFETAVANALDGAFQSYAWIDAISLAME
jgi:hypothetical protein